MARVGWSRTELQGHALVHLVDLQFAGQTYRLATAPLQLESAGDVLQYEATLDDTTWSRVLDLFSQQPEPESIIVSGFLPAEVAARVAEGHSLEGSAVQVSQVRVRPGGYGAAVDTHERRRVCISGRVVDAEYGATSEDGRAYVRFSAERNVFDSTTQIPLPHHRVTDRTWKLDGRVGGADVDAWYPYVIGYPGRDDAHPDGVLAGSIGAWIDKRRDFNVLALSVGPVEATTVLLATDDDPAGVVVNVRYTYTDASPGNLVPARDELGTLLAVVDYNQDQYDTGGGNELHASYRPAVDTDEQVFVGWPAGSGGMLWRGKVLRDAGDVLEWAMEQSGIPVDFGRFASARSQLAWCKVDTVVDAGSNPVEWVTTNLLPLLPVSLIITENGVAPWVWNPRTTRADAVCHLDADADPTLDVADTVKCDASNVVNTFELAYSYSQRTRRHTHTARLGPKRIDTTARAKGRIVFEHTTGFKRINLFALERGPNGAGISVTTTVSAAPLLVTPNVATRSVAINIKSTTDTAEDIVAAINATGLLVGASTSDDSGFTFIATDSPSITLLLPDFGTAGSPVCLRSQQVMASADKPGPNAGIRRKVLSTRILYDHGSAARVPEWQAYAYGLPHRRLEVEAPEAEYGWLDLGNPITFTYAALGFDEDLGLVEGMDYYSDGMVGLRLLFIDTTGWSALG